LTKAPSVNRKSFFEPVLNLSPTASFGSVLILEEYRWEH
jgi:hypothetical protein